MAESRPRPSALLGHSLREKALAKTKSLRAAQLNRARNKLPPDASFRFVLCPIEKNGSAGSLVGTRFRSGRSALSCVCITVRRVTTQRRVLGPFLAHNRRSCSSHSPCRITSAQLTGVPLLALVTLGEPGPDFAGEKARWGLPPGGPSVGSSAVASPTELYFLCQGAESAGLFFSDRHRGGETCPEAGGSWGGKRMIVSQTRPRSNRSPALPPNGLGPKSLTLSVSYNCRACTAATRRGFCGEGVIYNSRPFFSTRAASPLAPSRPPPSWSPATDLYPHRSPPLSFSPHPRLNAFPQPNFIAYCLRCPAAPSRTSPFWSVWFQPPPWFPRGVPPSPQLLLSAS